MNYSTHAYTMAVMHDFSNFKRVLNDMAVVSPVLIDILLLASGGHKQLFAQIVPSVLLTSIGPCWFWAILHVRLRRMSSVDMQRGFSACRCVRGHATRMRRMSTNAPTLGHVVIPGARRCVCQAASTRFPIHDNVGHFANQPTNSILCVASDSAANNRSR